MGDGHVVVDEDYSILAAITEMPLAKGYTVDKDSPAKKDQVMKAILPDAVSECSLCARRNGSAITGTCSTHGTVAKIAAATGVSGPDDAAIVRAAETAVGAKTERELVEKLAHKLGPDAKRELAVRFKVKGPINTEILSNREIEAILAQFAAEFSTFYSYGFAMLNFREYTFVDGRVVHKPDSLATISFAELYATGYRTCACIINSDTYQGPGKHWMALFADARGPRWSVEFFNSSGRAPAREWCSWLEQTRRDMREITDKKVKVYSVTAIKQQKTKTECGLYALTYVWARLIGVPPEYFLKTPIPDQFALEARYHYFVTPEYIHKFDWREFVRKNAVSWE